MKHSVRYRFKYATVECKKLMLRNREQKNKTSNPLQLRKFVEFNDKDREHSMWAKKFILVATPREYQDV